MSVVSQEMSISVVTLERWRAARQLRAGMPAGEGNTMCPQRTGFHIILNSANNLRVNGHIL